MDEITIKTVATIILVICVGMQLYMVFYVRMWKDFRILGYSSLIMVLLATGAITYILFWLWTEAELIVEDDPYAPLLFLGGV